MTGLINPEYAGMPIPKGFEIFCLGISDSTKEIIKDLYQTPEIRNLADIVENNSWHDQENVLDHAEATFANLQLLLPLDFVQNAELKQKYTAYLNAKIDPEGNKSREELLLIACALHDVSKAMLRPADDPIAPNQTYVLTNPDGTTRATGHEYASAQAVPVLVAGRDLTSKEITRIQALVARHDRFSQTFCSQNLSAELNKPRQDAEVLISAEPEMALEIVLHAVADEYGAEVTRRLREYTLHELIAKNSLI